MQQAMCAVVSRLLSGQFVKAVKQLMLSTQI
jgi:hypothetical protein